jgi:putative glycosyltransferase (TIGR04372 family)
MTSGGGRSVNGGIEFKVYRPSVPWSRRAWTVLAATARRVRWLAASAAASVLARVFKVAGCRLVRFPTFAFGHLVLEPDLFLKERALGLGPKVRVLWIVDRQRVANRCLLEMWRKEIPSLRIPFLNLGAPVFHALTGNAGVFLDTQPYISAINQTGKFGQIQNRWGGRPPLLRLPERHRSEGCEFLRRHGVPAGGWFACVHCRESGYHAGQAEHDFRNGSILDYEAAIDFVLANGGWVVRLGDPTMRKLKVRDGVIDFAHAAVRTEPLDLFFGAECRYVIGSCSGPSSLAAAFGRPMGMANCLPLSSAPFYCHNGLGIGVPKLLRREGQARFLSFQEIMESDIGNFRYASQYRRERLEIVDNDAEDILAMARELHAMAAGELTLDDEARDLQRAVKDLFRPGHYGYGSDCLISPAFLKKHRDLLGRG